MARNRKRDPRTDPQATLDDFVRRINRMGYSNATRVDVPLWTIKDIRWVAVLVEQFYKDLKEFGWGSQDIDPLQRVLNARWSAYRLAHALRYRTSNMEARKIVSRLPRIPD